jgi:L-threonylcarbamoyladenylate synthase
MEHGDFAAALATLAAGRVVAAATESFFGLLADAEAPQALSCLLGLKARGSDKGMPLVLPSREAFTPWVSEWPAFAQLLAERFWPGPLTIALPARPHVDQRLLLDGRIAARFPAGSPAQELCARYGRPLTATSANPAGLPPALHAHEVSASFAAAVRRGDVYVLSGSAPGGAPSTVVIPERDSVRIARAGAIPAAQILEVAQRAKVLLA